MFAYECFYRKKRITVHAPSSYDAREKAAAIFKARKSWEVTVVLAARPDGSAVEHSGAEFN